jgi:hypothetical protein
MRMPTDYTNDVAAMTAAAATAKTQKVAGSAVNAGTDTSAGKTHITVGGSDGTNLVPLKMTSGDAVTVENVYPNWSGRTTAQNATTTSGATVISTAAAPFADRTGVYITNLSSSNSIVIGIGESLGGSTPTVWEMFLPANASVPLNVPANVNLYVATLSGTATFSCKEFK